MSYDLVHQLQEAGCPVGKRSIVYMSYMFLHTGGSIIYCSIILTISWMWLMDILASISCEAIAGS